jgi:hypothetical protein
MFFSVRWKQQQHVLLYTGVMYTFARRNNEIFKDGNGSGSGERSAIFVDFAVLE